MQKAKIWVTVSRLVAGNTPFCFDRKYLGGSWLCTLNGRPIGASEMIKYPGWRDGLHRLGRIPHKLDNAQRFYRSPGVRACLEESSEEPDGSLVPEGLSPEWGDLGHWWAPHARAEARGPWVL